MLAKEIPYCLGQGALNNIYFMPHFLYMQVYDRLNSIGISPSYSHMLSVTKQISAHYKEALKNAATYGKIIRIIGDNSHFIIDIH